MLTNAKVRLRVVDPMGTDVADEVLVTNARGAVNKDVAFAKNAHTGRFNVRLELDDGKHTLLASDMVRVADFETPRFKVDVERDAGASPPQTVKARIVGRYLFGAPMGGAHATWVLKKSRVPVKGGTLAEAGLTFGRDYNWWEEAPTTEAFRPVTGEGVLGEDGVLPVDAVTGPLADGPTELVLEADVADASNRHVQRPAAHRSTIPSRITPASSSRVASATPVSRCASSSGAVDRRGQRRRGHEGHGPARAPHVDARRREGRERRHRRALEVRREEGSRVRRDRAATSPSPATCPSRTAETSAWSRASTVATIPARLSGPTVDGWPACARACRRRARRCRSSSTRLVTRAARPRSSSCRARSRRRRRSSPSSKAASCVTRRSASRARAAPSTCR